MRKLVLGVLLISCFTSAQSKSDFQIHSHNDYLQSVPFWKALSAGATSIEADVFLADNKLLVAHTLNEIVADRTIENLYFEPLQKAIALDLLGRKNIQILVDIKSEAYTTLDALIKKLEDYPDIIKNDNLSIVISGNRPKTEEYVNYPEYIHFDYQSLDYITDSSVLKKISLVSLSFKKFSNWNGKGRLTRQDFERVSAVVTKARSLGKPFRFWATPDSKTAWKALVRLGVDFINTDKPFECENYLRTLSKREFQNRSFSEVYRPTFISDGKNEKVGNIILLIGDGNGIAQISATALANKGELSLTQLRNIGFLKTQSIDDFTTDSAGGATAMATGQKVPNRAIGVDNNGNPLKNITEVLSRKGIISGIITTDEITGATPSAFYAHQKDRSMVEEIRKDLYDSALSVFVSSTDSISKGKNKLGHFEIQPSLEEVGLSKSNKIGFLFNGDEVPASLSKAVKNTLAFLNKKKKPFFLMIEGAKIDSYGHENEIDGVIRESIAFDKAITEALKFADSKQNTLVIVTADHETGGLTIPQGNVSTNEIEGDFTTDDHTGVMVPIFAYGPQSNNFQGVYENNELFYKMLKALNIKIGK